MHVKFIARGTGSARAAADYLLGERDAAGQPSEGVAVLRGDPDVVAAIADSLEFEHKYTSGVIAWSPDDRPTGEQIEAVLDEFEENGVSRTRARPLRLDGGRAPRARRRRARAHLRGTLRPGHGPEPQHRAARLAADVRPVARHLQRRARLEPAGRPGAGQGAAARTPGLHRGIEAAGRPGARGRRPASCSATTWSSGLSTAWCGTGPKWWPPWRTRALRTRAQGKSYITVRNPETGNRWRLKGGVVRT